MNIFQVTATLKVQNTKQADHVWQLQFLYPTVHRTVWFQGPGVGPYSYHPRYLKTLNVMNNHHLLVFYWLNNPTRMTLFVGLRPALEGLLSQCTRARAKQEVKSRRRSRRDLTYCSHKPECIVTTNPSRAGLNHDYNMTFLISPHGCPYSPLKWRSSRSKREPFRVLPPLLRHVVPLSDGKLLSHNALVKGHCARDAIPWTFHIEVFKCDQDNSDTITRIGDDSVELLDSC